MALELTIFLILLGASALLYLSGLIFKIPHLYLFGCVLLFGSAAMLWSFDGLITSHYYDVNGVLQSVIVDMSSVGMTMFMLILVAIPILSFFVIDLNPQMAKQKSPFHY